MEHFNRHRLAFVSITQNLSTADPVGRLTLNMLMSFAEFEWEMIADRIRDKVAGARRKGKWTGGIASLGYRSEKGRLAVVESEAPWVAQAFQWYLEGKSALEISQHLNVAEVPMRAIQKPDYRTDYADNLGKELPRIPRVKTAQDFWAFSKAGRALRKTTLAPVLESGMYTLQIW